MCVGDYVCMCACVFCNLLHVACLQEDEIKSVLNLNRDPIIAENVGRPISLSIGLASLSNAIRSCLIFSIVKKVS